MHPKSLHHIPCRHFNLKSTGITLVSCLVGLVITMVLLSLALPSWHRMQAMLRAAAATHQMRSVLSMARIAAVEQGVTTSICASTDGQTCGTDWSLGQLVFRDPQQHGQLEDLTQRIRFFPKLSANAHWVWQGFPPRQVIQFLSNGLPREQNGTFYYCPSDPHYMRAVILSKTGRVRVATREQYIGGTVPC